jgi:hypothetical protein
LRLEQIALVALATILGLTISNWWSIKNKERYV